MRQIIITCVLLFTVSSSFSQLVNTQSVRITNPYSSTMTMKLTDGYVSYGYATVGTHSSALYKITQLDIHNYKNFNIVYVYDEQCFQYDLNSLISSMEKDFLWIQFMNKISEKLLKNDDWIGGIWPLIRNENINPERSRNFRISDEIKRRYAQILNDNELSDEVRYKVLTALQIVQIAETADLPVYSQKADLVLKEFVQHQTYTLPISHFIKTIRTPKLQLEAGILSHGEYTFFKPVKDMHYTSFKSAPYFQGRLHFLLNNTLTPQRGKLYINDISLGYQQNPLLYSPLKDETASVSSSNGLSYHFYDVSFAMMPYRFYTRNSELRAFISAGYGLSFRRRYSLYDLQAPKAEETKLESGRAVFAIGLNLRVQNIFLKATASFTGLAKPVEEFSSDYLKSSSNTSFSLTVPLVLSQRKLRYR